jgi:ornithine decarboxylase
VLASGAYAVSYMAQGFNGFNPLPYTCVRGEDGPHGDPRRQETQSRADLSGEGAR